MPKQSYSKPALTIEQQIAQLRRRGMLITDTLLAAHYLSQINYYRLTEMLARHHIGPARMGFPDDWKTREIWR